MLLSEKIMTLRKESGLSQEELAEQLNVSRQSISKWESAVSIPDMNKIIALSEYFNVSTDYLLIENNSEKRNIKQEDNRVILPIEFVNQYLKASNESSKNIGVGVALCVISPAIVLLSRPMKIITKLPESVVISIGVISLVMCIYIAIILFIQSTKKTEEFKSVFTKDFSLSYGVEDIIKKKYQKIKKKTFVQTTIAIGLIFLGVTQLVLSLFYTQELYNPFNIIINLLFLAISMYLFIYNGGREKSFNEVLQVKQFSPSSKKMTSFEEAISGYFWVLITAIYFTWGIVWNGWAINWLVFIFGGIIFGVFIAYIKYKKE